jgi:outer membrane protein insertion porin family
MENSYEISTKGGSLGYGIPLTENTRINTNLEYSQNKIKCGTTFSSSSYESSQCNKKTNDELKLNMNWSENTLNDYLYPTMGESNSISLNIATPVGDYRYISLGASHSSYSPVSKNVTLKLSGDLNVAKGYSGKELPFFKRYFGGGSGSVRGFGNKTLGPLYLNGKAKGGELSVFGSANLITPAFFFDSNEKMRLSAFIDAGNIFEKSSSIELSDVRMSSGIGFAYLSPIGAIGAYWSTPILKKSGDIIENFGLSLGAGF